MAGGPIGNMTIRVDLDSTGFNKGMAGLNRQMKMVGAEMASNLSVFDKTDKSVDKLRTRYDGLSKMQKVQEERVKQLKDKYEDLSSKTGENSAKTQAAAAEYNKANAELNAMTKEVSELGAELKKLESPWGSLSNKMNEFGDKAQKIGGSMVDIGKKASMYITAPVIGVFTAGTKAAVDWESALAGVNKTLADTDSLDVIAEGIRNMSKELPVAATEIAGVTELAQQLGVSGEENVLTFTRAIIDMGESTNMTREQAAEQMAKFANIMGMPIDKVNELGSTIVELGNNYATTESDIMNMGMRLAGMGKLTGMTEADVMALSATMSSLGVEAESGGTAMTQVMNKMSNAVANGGADLDKFAKAAGVSSEEFANAFNDRPIEALTMLIKGLEESGMSAGEMNEVLGELGIKGIREADSIKRLVGSSEMLAEATEKSSQAFKDGNALKDEASVRYETMASKMQLLKNNLVDLGIDIGQLLMPYISKFLDFIVGLTEKFSGLSDTSKKIIVALAGIAAAIGPILGVAGSLIIFIGSIAKTIAPLLPMIGKLGGLTKILGAVMGALTGPIGLTVLAIAGLGTAFTVAYKKSETFRNIVHGALNGVKEVVSTVKDAVVGFVQGLFENIKSFWESDGQTTLNAFNNIWNIVLATVQHVTPLVELLFNNLMIVIKNVWNAIKSIISGALDVIMGVVKVFSGLFTGDFSKMWEGIKQIFSGAKEAIVGIVKALLNIVIGIATNLKNMFINMMSQMKDRVVSLFTTLFNGVTNILSNLYNGAKNSVNNIRTYFVNGITTMKNRVVSIINTMKDTALRIFTKIVDGAKAIPGRMKDALINGKDKVISGIKSLGNSMASTLGKVVNGVIGGINTVMSKIGIKKSLSTWNVPAFSTGTGQGSPSGKLTRNGQIAMDTLAVVGDKGPGNGKGTRELVHYPNGQVGLYDNDAMIFAPKGTTIFNNKQTEELLNQIPRFSIGTFAKNVGGKVKSIAGKAIDYITNPSKIFDDLVNAVMPSWDIGAFMLDFGKGIWKQAKDALFDWMKARFAEAGQGKKQPWMNRYPITTPYSPNAPVPGYPRAFNGGRHFGIDWGTPIGVNLTSPVAGTVKYQSDHGGGRVARVDYGKGAMYFLHMNSVKSGKVAIGESLGRSGNTGAYTTGPHVHVQDENPKTSFLQNRNTRNPMKMFKSHADGGWIKSNGLFNLHADEYVIPMNNPTNAMKLIAHMSQRLAGKSKQTSQLSNCLNNSNDEMLDKMDNLIQLVSALLLSNQNIEEKDLNINVNDLLNAQNKFKDDRSLLI